MPVVTRRKKLLWRIAAAIGLGVPLGLGLLYNAGHHVLAVSIAVAVYVVGFFYLGGVSRVWEWRKSSRPER
jgi:RsiW-degrading membrane proteinase PrsW (M82 family)